MFEKILLAVDGSEHSNRAVEVAADIARKSDGEVYAIHVHEVGLVVPVETNLEAHAIVDDTVNELLADGVKAGGDAVSARSGGIPGAIAESAESFGAGLIVMGTRGLSDVSGMLLGSVAHKVIRHAACPVLVVR